MVIQVVLQVACYGLRVAGCVLRVTGYESTSRNPLLKNGVNSFNIKRLHENWPIMILDTGNWMLEKGVARAAQALSPRIALLLFIKSTEYLVNPGSSIQYPAS
jgi:hypothetical protein